MIKVLWIEDGALHEAQNLAAPVYNSRKYELVIAADISEAIMKIMEREYDVLIFDIRMDPGDNPEWEALFEKSHRDKLHARLGLHLLRTLLKSKKQLVRIDDVPSWIEPYRIGVLTVETRRELERDLAELGIRAYESKNAMLPGDALLRLIENVLSQKRQIQISEDQ